MIKSSVKVKYLSGWLSSEKIKNIFILSHWIETAKKAEELNCQLTVFKIPVSPITGFADSETVELIEKLIQERHG